MPKPFRRHAWPILALSLATRALGAQQPPTPIERDHALAWGAHHLCAGLFVVGRDYERAPDVMVAEDIPPFPWFRWEDAFTYDVDWSARRVTVAYGG